MVRRWCLRTGLLRVPTRGSPDGSRVAVHRWGLPAMPWDGDRASAVVDVAPERSSRARRARSRGGERGSIFQPALGPRDGSLTFVIRPQQGGGTLPERAPDGELTNLTPMIRQSSPCRCGASGTVVVPASDPAGGSSCELPGAGRPSPSRLLPIRATRALLDSDLATRPSRRRSAVSGQRLAFVAGGPKKTTPTQACRSIFITDAAAVEVLREMRRRGVRPRVPVRAGADRVPDHRRTDRVRALLPPDETRWPSPASERGNRPRCSSHRSTVDRRPRRGPGWTSR
jgi:hypothetical protein